MKNISLEIMRFSNESIKFPNIRIPPPAFLFIFFFNGISPAFSEDTACSLQSNHRQQVRQTRVLMFNE